MEAEGRAQPVGGVVTDQRRRSDDGQEQKRAQGDRVGAVGARVRLADTQLREHGREAGAVRLPDGGGARIVGVGGDRVLVGGGRPVRDAGDALDAAYRLLAGGERYTHGEQQRGDAGDAEGGEQGKVGLLAEQRPDAQERDEQEQPGEAQISHSRGHSRSNRRAQRLARTLRAKAASRGAGPALGSAIG